MVGQSIDQDPEKKPQLVMVAFDQDPVKRKW